MSAQQSFSLDSATIDCVGLAARGCCVASGVTTRDTLMGAWQPLMCVRMQSGRSCDRFSMTLCMGVL